MKRRNAVLAVLGAIVGCGGEMDSGDGGTSTPRSTRYIENAFSPNPQCTMPSTWDPAIGQPSAAALKQLAPTGTLRVAVYYGNQGIGVCTPSSGKGCLPAFDPQFGVLSGTAVDLACRLQAQLKIPLVFTGYPTIAALNAGFAVDSWEIGFGYDPDLPTVPSSKVSHPYIGIDNTFLVPDSRSDLRTIADLDKLGVTIAVQSGNTPDLFMRANFQHATLVELVTNNATNDIFPLVKAGKCNTDLCKAAGYTGHIDAAAGGRFGESSFVLTTYHAGRVLSPSLVLARIAPFIRPSLEGDASFYLAEYLEAARASGLLKAIVGRLPFQNVGNVSCTNDNQCPTVGSISEVCSAPTNGKCGLGNFFARSVPPAQPGCAPAVKCQDVTVPADGSCHASASINAGSSDADSDLAGCTQNPPGPYPEGTTPVTLTCSDTEGQTSSCTAKVRVVDKLPPVVTTNPGDVNGFIASLWPPNHSYHTVSLSDCFAAAVDQCDGTAVTTRIVGVTSDEPAGHGQKGNDILIANDGASVQLRAARDGSGDGRVYTIFATAADDDGNATQVTCQVQVPHDQSGAPAVDSGPAYCIGTCN